MTPARTYASSLSIVLALVIVGTATQSFALGMILFLVSPLLLILCLRSVWRSYTACARRPAAPAVVRKPVVQAAPAITAPVPAPTSRVFVVEPAPVSSSVPRELSDSEIEMILDHHYRETLGSIDGRDMLRMLVEKATPR